MTRETSRKLLQILLRDKGLKAASLLLAFVTWYSIRTVIGFEVVLRGVPVEFKLDEGTAVLDQSESTVDVKFRGSREEVGALPHSQVKVVLDLAAFKTTGAYIAVPVRTREVKGATGGARAVSVTPGRVFVRLDRETDKKVPVKPMVQGKPLFGRITQVACEPAVVSLHGPYARIKDTDVLPTAVIDAEGRVESFSRRVEVMPPSETWGSRIEPREVKVTVTIAKDSQWKDWPDVPVAVLAPVGQPLVAEVQPPTVTVSVNGDSETLSRVDANALRAFVDCTAGVQPGASYDLPVRTQVPADMGVTTRVTPENVSVKLRESR